MGQARFIVGEESRKLITQKSVAGVVSRHQHQQHQPSASASSRIIIIIIVLWPSIQSSSPRSPCTSLREQYEQLPRPSHLAAAAGSSRRQEPQSNVVSPSPNLAHQCHQLTPPSLPFNFVKRTTMRRLTYFISLSYQVSPRQNVSLSLAR